MILIYVFLEYVIIGLVVFFSTELFTVIIAGYIGPGENEIGYVIVGLSLLATIVVLCTVTLSKRLAAILKRLELRDND